MADTDDVSRMPLEERLASKLWKARLSAYEELAASFARTPSSDDALILAYARQPDTLRGMALDANAAAQEKGVECLCAFVRYGAHHAGRTRDVVMPSVAEKCLGSMRTGTRKAALELVLLYAEHEDTMGCDGLVSDISDKLAAKQPKVVAANVAALTALVRAFGGEQVNVRLVAQCVPKVFAHADKQVRAEGADLAVELHRWIGAGLAPVLAQLKDIQAKELEQRFAEAPAATAPTRYLASRQPTEAPAREPTPPPAAVDEPPPPAPSVDPYDMAEPVNPLQSRRLSPTFFDMVTSTKWQERIEALESLHAALTESPRLVRDPGLDEYVQALHVRIQKDANINVVLHASRCLEALARGLRQEGAPYTYVLPTLLDKLKERKPATLEVLHATLDAVYLCSALPEILEPVSKAAVHKNPAVKAGTIRFLGRCLASARPSPQDIAVAAPILVHAMSDGTGDVRDAAASSMGALLQVVGERPLLPYLDKLDDLKRAKVREEANVRSSTAPAPKAAPVPQASPAPKAVPAPKPAAVPRAAPLAKPAAAPKLVSPPKPTAAPKAAPTAKSAAKPTPPTASRGAPAPKAVPRTAPKAAAREETRSRFAPEEADALARDLIPPRIQEQLASPQWKERLEGAQALTAWLDDADADVLAHFLAQRPGWRESNFQVMGEVFRCMQRMTQLPTFGRATVALTVQPMCEKLGDMKLKALAGETLLQYAEVTSLSAVLTHGVPWIGALKAPKAQADALVWMDQAILAFGAVGLDVPALVTFLGTCLASANPAVRTSATAVVVTLARFAGPSVVSLLPDITPQLRSTIETQVQTAPPPPPPTRSARAAAPVPEDEPAEAVPAAPLDDALPRVEIDTLVSPATLASSSDSAWKVRKEALERIRDALRPHARLRGGMELAQTLRPRFLDTNLMVRTLALDMVIMLAQGTQPFEPLARVLGAPVTQVLADSKAPLRASAKAALSAMAHGRALGPLLAPMGHVLDGKHANPTLRQELFAWLHTYMTETPGSPGDVHPLIPSVVASLDDRAAPVRQAAQSLLPFLVQYAGPKALYEAAAQLKGASRATATPLIDAARGSAPSTGRAVSTASTASTASSASSAKEPSRGAARRPLPPRAPETPRLSAVNRSLAPRAPRPHTETALLLSADAKGKAARERASRTPLVVDGTVRPAEIEALRHQMDLCCAPTLVAALFSQDHHAERDYLQGTSDLLAYLAKAPSAPVLAQSDVLIKYACVRVLDRHTSVALRCMELLSTLMDVLSAHSTHLTESEAQALLATLLVRLGDAKPMFREQARDLLRRSTVLFPPSRVFSVLLEHGVTAKHVRTRAESLQELAFLLGRQGLGVCTPSKAFPVMASCISDRDAAVRGAALSALTEAYQLQGDALWRLLGPLSARDQALLEERCQRTMTRPARRAAPEEDDVLAQICRDDKEESIAGLKSLQAQLGERSLPASDTVHALLHAWDAVGREPELDHRYIKHILQSILVLLDTHMRLDASQLSPLLEGLLRRLMYVSAQDHEASQTLSKQLNAVVLRILSMSHGDDVYQALFSLLVSTTADVAAGDQAQLAELVVKCLWKVARKLPAALEAKQVHAEALLRSVERFFEAIPPSEWAQRAQKHVPLRDIPLITATNVLKQLTDTLGEGALAATDAWTEPEKTHVYRYLLRLLHGPSPPPAADAPSSPPPPAPSPAPPAASDDAPTEELRAIFDAISQKDKSRAAIRDLYEFQKRHPSMHASIERSLQNTGPIFQRYIKRALANHAAEDEAPAPPTPSTSVDARLAELKAKFRREPSRDAPERMQKRMSMSTEALRTRLATMRTDDAAPSSTM